MTVTLGPFFFSSAADGPGNSKKKTEPTTRAATNRTFMFRSERRTIHREKLARLGRRGRKRVGMRRRVTQRLHRGHPGGPRGSCTTPRGRRAPFPPPLIGRRMVGLDAGRSPARRLGRAETPARGWLPRYCSLIGSASR